MTTSIFVDSRFATRGDDSNFHIQLRESITTSENARLRIDKLRFIDSFFTTDSGAYLYIKSGESFTTVALPQQAYTGARLATMIQSLTGKTTTYLDATNSLVVSYDENTKFLSDDEISQLDGTFPPNTTKQNPRSINRCLGPSIVENGQQIFPVITMQPYTDVYLRSRRLTRSNMHGPDERHDILCKIPLSEGVGKTVVASSPDNIYYYLGGITLRGIDFQLTDVYGNPVNLRGRPLSFQLIIED